MIGQQVEELNPLIVAEIEAERREIARRANLLCRRAEPHTDEVPCPPHLHEAQRQLFGQLA